MADETTRISYSDPSKLTTNIFKYPRDLNDKEDDFAWTKFRFFKYKPPLAVTRTSTNIGQSLGNYNSSVTNQEYIGPTIALYSPEDIQAEYGVQWGGRAIQNFTRDTIAGIASPGSSITNLFQSLADGSAATDIGAYAFSGLAAAGLQALQNLGQGEGIGLNDLLGGTAGVVLNPNTELLFQGFDLRNFNLQYKFVARSRTEADEIQNIIRWFKYAMLPGLNGSVNTGTATEREQDPDNAGQTKVKRQNAKTFKQDRLSRNFIQVPYLCDMQFMYGKTANEYITQFKPCAITGLTFNQTPDGLLSLYQRGEPTAITMNISFQETKLVYREEIKPSGFTY